MCGDFIDEFYQDEIDIPALLRDLKLNKDSLSYYFDASIYLVNSFSVFLVPTMVSPVTPIPWKDSSKPYKYRDRNGTEKECDFEGIKLNKRVCLIEDSIAIYINFDGSKFIYKLKIAYKDATSFKSEAVDTDIKTDFRLSDKYNAVIIPTNDIEDVYELFKQYYGSTYNFKWLEDYISYRIFDIYFKTNLISEIKAIYEEAPIFALQRLGDLILISDLEELLKYDKGNWIVDGWFKDSSDAIIKLLSSFNNLETLYNYLYNDVKNLMDIYNHLDKQNCIALGQIIDMLIMYKRLKDPNFQSNIAEQEYVLGGGYSIDSSILGPVLNETPESIYLRNLIEKTEIVGYNAKTGFPIERKTESTIYENEFHPFTLIPLKQIIGGKVTIEYQSALLVKAQADANEWTDVVITAQIVANILAIIISIATFGTATPFAMALLALEIGVTAADIYVISIQKELEQTEGGCEFLEKWNKFMLVGAVVTAGPALFKGTLQLGSRILKSTASQATKHFVTKCIATAILERNIASFAKSGTKTTIKEAIILNDSINSANSGFRLSTNFLDELFKNDAYILKSVTNEGKESYHLVYKGEILEEADTVLEIEKSLSGLGKKRGAQLIEKLDETLLKRKTISMVDETLLGKTPEKGIKMFFDLKDGFGNTIGQLIRNQEKVDKLVYSISLNGKVEKLNCFTRLLDEKMAKINRLPVFGDEKMLMGDFNIPKTITDEYSGLGDLMLSDAMAFYKTNKKFGQIDGVIGWWKKASMYEDYGGQSINLTKFWEARKAGKSIEDAALSTFTGSKMKRLGFGKVRFDIDNIKENEIVINFLKEQ